MITCLISHREQICRACCQGVTASALQECLTKLDVRKEEALLTLFASAAEHFSTDGAAAGPALDQDADALASELSCSTALASLQARGLAQDEASAHVAALAGQHAEVCSGLQVTLEAAGGVRVAAELQQRLADYDAHVAAGSYTEAAWTGMELEKACAAAPELEGMAAAVEGRIHPLRQYLITAAPQYLPPDAATHVLTAPPPPEHTAAALAEIWRAAEVLGVLLQALQTLATHAVEHSVKPILAAEVAAGAGGVIESPAGSIASSSLSLATTRADGRAGTERLVYKTLKVLCEQGLGGRSELAAQLGEVLWPAAGGAYIAAKLRPVRPQTDAELEAFTRRGGVGVKLEAKAVKLGLIPGEGEGPITGYMQKTVGRFLGVKRARYAAAARDVLTSSAAQETVVVAGEGNYAKSPTVERAGLPGRALFGAASGAEAELAGEHSVLDVGSFTVTRAAQGLSTLMHDAVAEACRSGSPALAQAMCGAVVDMAALLVALPPLAGADAAVELPYPSALRYGDCLHVYRTLCALPHSYAPRLQSLVHVNVNFIAPANRVRTAGDAALDAMVEREKTQLVHVAGEVSACFSGMDDVAAARCRKGVMQLVHGFRRLGAVLRGVLPPAKFVEVAAALAEAACGRICGESSVISLAFSSVFIAVECGSGAASPLAMRSGLLA